MTRAWRVAVLPGDGNGPEVTEAAVKVFQAAAAAAGLTLHLEWGLAGQTAYAERGDSLPPETMELCDASDAIFVGAFNPPGTGRRPLLRPPETPLKALHRRYALYAGVRPARLCPALVRATPPDTPDALGPPVGDVMLVGDLAAGLQAGRAQGTVALIGGGWRAYDICSYTSAEVTRVALVALRLARQRRRRLVSVDRADTLVSGMLWREEVQAIAAAEFPDVAVGHLTLDDAVAQLLEDPAEFDVLLGDSSVAPMLAATVAVLAGSPALLPSISLGDGPVAVYGSARSGAPGRGAANPVGAILAMALLLRYTCGADRAAAAVESAVAEVLTAGWHTSDTPGNAEQVVETRDMGERIATALAAELGR